MDEQVNLKFTSFSLPDAQKLTIMQIDMMNKFKKNKKNTMKLTDKR